jgi:Icc-related predicted phosphoesterase
MEEGMLESLPFSIYFTSYQLPFFDWAFNEPEEKMAAMYAKIPVGTDIIVSHGPPLGYGDYVSRGENTGSKALLDAIDRVKPKLVVFGHIHSGYGSYQRNDSLLINASIVNEKYNVVNAPIVIDSETWKIV